MASWTLDLRPNRSYDESVPTERETDAYVARLAWEQAAALVRSGAVPEPVAEELDQLLTAMRDAIRGPLVHPDTLAA